MRALTGRDIATGTIDLQKIASNGEQYSTEGPGDTWWKLNDVLPSPPGECYLWDTGRCTEEEIGWVRDGTAIVKDWIVIGRGESKHSLGDAGGQAQMPLTGDW